MTILATQAGRNNMWTAAERYIGHLTQWNAMPTRFLPCLFRNERRSAAPAWPLRHRCCPSQLPAGQLPQQRHVLVLCNISQHCNLPPRRRLHGGSQAEGLRQAGCGAHRRQASGQPLSHTPATAVAPALPTTTQQQLALTAACVALRCPPHTSQWCCRWEAATLPHLPQRRSCSWKPSQA